VALLAITLGWLIIVPPFISVYNTSKHVVRMEEGLGIQQQLSPALNVILLLVVGIAIPAYTQEHLNRVWDGAGRITALPSPSRELPPPPA